MRSRSLAFVLLILAALVPGCVSDDVLYGSARAESLQPIAQYQIAPEPHYPQYGPGIGQPCPPSTSAQAAYRPAPQRTRRAPRGVDLSRHPWYPGCGKISRRWTTIVIHHSATHRGGARSFDKNHRESRGWDELGYHFVIGNGTDTPNGYVEVGSRWHKQKHGAHCKTPSNYYNDHGIGICLVGNFESAPPSRNQMASLVHLVRFLSQACGIPPERITTHRHVNGKTKCPGRYFSLAEVHRALSRPATASSMR
jgi:hypothetical protein